MAKLRPADPVVISKQFKLKLIFHLKNDKMLKKIRWSPTEKADSLAVKNMNIRANHCL